MLLLQLNTKKIAPLLLLIAFLTYGSGLRAASVLQSALTVQSSQQEVIKSASTKTRELSPEDKELLLKISSDHNKLLLACLIFTIFSSLLVYFLIQSRHKRERFMESYFTETRIAKKVHDEIANEIYSTLNYLSTEKDISGETREKLITKLDDIYLLTKNISRETNTIDTGYDFPEHLKMMLTAYSGNAVNVIIKGLSDIEWNTIHALKKIATYRSLQEMMVNMKKHSQASLVVIDFTTDRKKVDIHYTDNGLGASEKELFQKNGLLNIENRMIAVDGASKFESDTGKGFRATLTYPV